MSQTLETTHPFSDAAAALAACDEPERLGRMYDALGYEVLRSASERALAAARWLDAHPVEAAAARADRAQLAVLAWRELSGRAATPAEREACLTEAAAAADDLSFQLNRLAEMTRRAA